MAEGEPAVSISEAGAAPPPLPSPCQVCRVGVEALSGFWGSFCSRVWLLDGGPCAARVAGHGGLPGGSNAACGYSLHLRISSQLSHCGIDDIAGWRDMTAPAPSTTQMTPPCYQLNFSGIFFFLSHQIPEVFFQKKMQISLQLNCNKPLSSKCWIKRPLFKCFCWPDEMPWGQWLLESPPFTPVSPQETGANQAGLVRHNLETSVGATGALFSSTNQHLHPDVH